MLFKQCGSSKPNKKIEEQKVIINDSAARVSEYIKKRDSLTEAIKETQVESKALDKQDEEAKKVEKDIVEKAIEKQKVIERKHKELHEKINATTDPATLLMLLDSAISDYKQQN